MPEDDNKMGNEQTYTDRLDTLLEEARAANKIGESRKPVSEFLMDFERKQKAFEEAQQQKLKDLHLGETSMPRSPDTDSDATLFESPPPTTHRESEQDQSGAPSISSNKSASRLDPSVSAYQPLKHHGNDAFSTQVPPPQFRTQAEHDIFYRGAAHGYSRGAQEGYARSAFENYMRGSKEGHEFGSREGYARGFHEGSARAAQEARQKGIFQGTVESAAKVQKVKQIVKEKNAADKGNGVGWF